MLQSEGCQAVRGGGYSHGIVFSIKELKSDELFEVKIDEVDEQWSGSLHIGLTTLQPADIPCTFPGLSSRLLDLRTKVTWLVTGSEVRRNGTLQKQNYGCSLDRLRVGNRVGVKRCSDDSMHILIDGEDMGPAATAVAKNVYAVLDLYGRVTAVSVVSSTALDETEGTKVPSLSSEICSEEEEEPTPCENEAPLVPTTMQFLENHGKNILLSNQNLTATRVSSYNQGLLVTNQPLPRQQLFQRGCVFHNSLKICDNYGPNLDTCPEGTVLGLLVDANSCLHLYVNGMDQGVAAQDIPSPCFPLLDLYGQCEQICDNYGPNLDTCPEGTVLGLLVDANSCLHLYVNGMDQGVAAQDIPSPCFPLLDLYGQCEQVTIVTNDVPAVGGDSSNPRCQGDMEKADMVDGIKESVCWTPPLEVNPMKMCEYQALCSRFKDLLSPARINPRCDAANTFKKWHMAYHGTSVGALRRTLDQSELVTGSASIFSAAQTKGDVQNGFSEPEENSAPEREEVKVQLSPTMRYSGLDNFAPKVQDPRSLRCHHAQVALQVCVRPGSYKIGAQSLGLSEALDPRFSNSEIEWISKEKGGTLLYGLLIRIDPGSYKIGAQSLGLSEALDPRFSNSEIEWISKEKGGTLLYGLLIRIE
ncbi:UNVERIFIED_CONTAM: hypothetical protein FKN15_007340 [Acipenser sinensis]